MDPSNHAKDDIPRKADHLCVLIHGFWGNPSHMDHLAASLRERYSDDHLRVLVLERNAGTLTYDGIEVGGERAAYEIEETLNSLADEGCRIQKLSIVGYSFGGLVARYAIGLLYARGWLDKLEPVNFTTFVSPHVGVRIPLKGIWSHIWNNVGPQQGSTSVRQLFMVDSFGDTGRPMLSVLADPDSIFMRALARFQNRCLYANVINDRTTIFYTTSLSTVDPFRDLESLQVNYVKGYEPVVIDPDMYFLPSGEVKPKECLSLGSRIWRFLSAALFSIFIVLFLCIVLPLFFLHSVCEWSHSRQRVRVHEEGKSGTLFKPYRVMIKEVQSAIEEVYEDVGFRQDPEYLSVTTKTGREDSITRRNSPKHSSSPIREDRNYPTLALTPAQITIIESLNSVGFRKYPVYIHNHRHSHAAIIVRVPNKGFDEGKIVTKHWLDNEFQV
ncbi:putative serine esterase-domain-containing protein [Aspergillus coremiiformis]|uniref:Putative serine esterase-domain-containing protein n=1 Tax=Aspergillus coremiiformis TaxID=138285 RepID=A0A5N6ZBX8_9EURO|nr:putative serine esterase-domain-containing protein [Aspergillus coremiiformis]